MASENKQLEAVWFDLNVRGIRRYVRSEVLPRLAFIICFVALWWVTALVFAHGLLPTPGEVLDESILILQTGDFLYHLVNSLRRVLVAFLLAWVFSIALGIFMGVSERAEKFFDMGVVIGLTIPGLATAIITVMLFGLRPLTAYLAVFVAVFPMIVLNFWEGVKDIDMDLVEMGTVFDFSTTKTLQHVIIPQLIPYMLSAGRLGMGLAWKLVVIVEFLGFGNGIGYMLTAEYNQFNMAAVLAWTLLFTIVMIVIEYGGFKFLERRYLAWRPAVEIRRV